MKVIDLRLPKLSKEETAKMEEPTSAASDSYPYGFRLTFESEQVEKLPEMQKYKVGEKVKIGGIGEVTSIRMNEEQGGKKRYTVEIQLHKVGCASEENYDEAWREATKGGEEDVWSRFHEKAEREEASLKVV